MFDAAQASESHSDPSGLSRSGSIGSMKTSKPPSFPSMKRASMTPAMSHKMAEQMQKPRVKQKDIIKPSELRASGKLVKFSKSRISQATEEEDEPRPPSFC